MTFCALKYPQILFTSRISDRDLANIPIQKGTKCISVSNPSHTQMHKDQEKKQEQKQKKECQAFGSQLSKEHLVIIRINFEENDTIGVLERINTWHNEIFAVFFPPSMKEAVFPTRCEYLLHKY